MSEAMSSQAPTILLGQRVKPPADELTGSDLQQMVGKLLSILRYRRWLFALPLLTGIMAVLGGSLFVPRQYLLRTVFERRDDPVLLKLVSNSPYTFELQRHAFRYSIMGQAAIEEGLDMLAAQEPAWSDLISAVGRRPLVNELGANLAVIVSNSNPNYDLFELRYTGERLDLAERLLPILRENYIRRTQASLRSVQQQAQAFFLNQVEEKRGLAARRQAELTQVTLDQPEVDPNKPEYLHQRILAEERAIEELNRSRQEVAAEIEAREEYLRQVDEQQREGRLPTGSPLTTRLVETPRLAQLQAAIAQVKSEIADAKTVRHMKDTHPHVESLNRKLVQLQIEFEQTERPVAATADRDESPWDAERSRVAMDLKGLTVRREQYERDLAAHREARAELEAQKLTLFERQQKFTLQRQELETLKTDLGVWQGKLEEINRIMEAESLDRGVRFVNVEECRRPSKPSTPKLQATFVLSGAVGLALAVALVFLRELLDRSFRNPARVRQLLGIPVLEAIGEIGVRRSPRNWLIKLTPPTIALVQTCCIVALSWLVYLRLERPEAYANWLQTLSTWSGVREWLT